MTLAVFCINFRLIELRKVRPRSLPWPAFATSWQDPPADPRRRRTWVSTSTQSIPGTGLTKKGREIRNLWVPGGEALKKYSFHPLGVVVHHSRHPRRRRVLLGRPRPCPRFRELEIFYQFLKKIPDMENFQPKLLDLPKTLASLSFTPTTLI